MIVLRHFNVFSKRQALLSSCKSKMKSSAKVIKSSGSITVGYFDIRECRISVLDLKFGNKSKTIKFN